MNRTAVIALAMGAAAVALVAVVMLGGSDQASPSTAAAAKAPVANKNPASEEDWEDPEHPKRAPADPRLVPSQAGETRDPPPPTPQFQMQSDDDKKRLGDTAYAEMQRLWLRGRHPRAAPEAMTAMEELIEKYPDTNRAGCARYELGQHHLKDGRVPPSQRMKAAEPLLTAARARHAGTRCEGDVSAGNMAALALALDVYRHTDRRLALSILDELSALPPTETDRLGRPLAEKAKLMKEHLPPGLDNPDKSEPLPGTEGK